MPASPECDQLIEQIRRHYGELQQANANLRWWHASYQDDLIAQHKQALTAVSAASQELSRAGERLHREETKRTDAVFSQAVQEIAGGWSAEATADLGLAFIAGGWDHPAWQNYSPPAPGAPPLGVRIGDILLDDNRREALLPALAPLIGHRHLLITHPPVLAAPAHELLQSILLRLALTFPPRTLQLSLLEPGGDGGILSAFLHLPQPMRGAKVFARPDEVTAQLAQINEHIENVVQARLRNVYATLEEYNAANEANAVPYRILAVPALTGGIDERQWQTLLQIARSGPRAGVYIVAALDAGAVLPRTVRRDDLLALGAQLLFDTDQTLTWDDPDWGRYPVRADRPPPAAQVNGWLQLIGEAAEAAQVALPFGRIATPRARWWQANSRQGLRVPVGLDSLGGVQEFALDEVDAAHVLVGGATGSDKSNFLHVLITQLALAYSPAELELYLIDFRQGVEFQDYRDLPHARVLGIESEREFGLSILLDLAEQLKRRGERFKAAGGASSLAEHRQATGAILPRILLIIDEFQVLFETEDAIAREAARILELLARQGRGFGIHILLSSQAPAVSTLTRSVYEQMKLRIAFTCGENVSRAILGEGNTAAAALAHSGEAIYNNNRGEHSANRQVRIALFGREERRTVLAALRGWNDGRFTAAPRTFDPHRPARLEDNADLRRLLAGGWADTLAGAKVWLGDPVAIAAETAVELVRYEGSNLLIVGDNEEQAYGLLLAAVLSLAAQRPPQQAHFLVADFSRPGAPYAPIFRQLGLPHPLHVFTPRLLAPGAAAEARPRRSSLWSDAPGEPAAGAVEPPTAADYTSVAGLERSVQERWQALERGELPADTANVYFVVAGLDRWRGLAGERDLPPAARQLLRIAALGPDVGVHLLVWTNNVKLAADTLRDGDPRYSLLDCCDLRVLLRLDERDSSLLLNSSAAARLPDHRALLRDRRWTADQTEKFKPYGVPAAAALAALLDQIRRKAAPAAGLGNRSS